jgi:catalase-peroxidase
MTDIISFNVLEPKADAFRNYLDEGIHGKTEKMMIDKAQLLTLTVPEMTVLIGGMRVLGGNYKNTDMGVFTSRKGVLSNDFFVNLLDNNIEWKKVNGNENLFEGHERNNGEKKWQGSRVDLIFGAHSELRAVCEVYASSDGKEKFVKDFVSAWTKVMNLDLYYMSH